MDSVCTTVHCHCDERGWMDLLDHVREWDNAPWVDGDGEEVDVQGWDACGQRTDSLPEALAYALALTDDETIHVTPLLYDCRWLCIGGEPVDEWSVSPDESLAIDVPRRAARAWLRMWHAGGPLDFGVCGDVVEPLPF